jgi:hypothetical protein
MRVGVAVSHAALSDGPRTYMRSGRCYNLCALMAKVSASRGRCAQAEEPRMKSYTITIAPDDATGAVALIEVLVNDAGPMLKRFSLAPSAGSVLSMAEISQFDSERLVSTALLAASFMPAAGSRKDEAVASESGSPAASSLPYRPSLRQTSAQAKRGSRPASKKSDASVGAPPSCTDSGDTASPGAEPKSRRRTQVKLTHVTANGDGGRNYRTMPDDFFDRFGTKTMSALATDYAVPLHTIQSWINTARKQGKLPPARQRSGSAKNS